MKLTEKKISFVSKNFVMSIGKWCFNDDGWRVEGYLSFIRKSKRSWGTGALGNRAFTGLKSSKILEISVITTTYPAHQNFISCLPIPYGWTDFPVY